MTFRCFSAKRLLVPPASLNKIWIKSNASTFPIIPRIRTFLPHPIQQPHRCLLQVISDIESWAKSLITNSISDDSVRSLFDPKYRRLADPCVYVSLMVNPQCNYDQLLGFCKFFVFLQTIDDLLEFNRRYLAGQEVFDYITKFKENPDLVHYSAGDHKRHFLLNLVGHALTGLRLGGMNPNRFRRQINTLEAFAKMCVHTDDRPSEVNWSNYWPTRLENAGFDMGGNMTETSYGFESIQQIANDPDVQAVVEASTKLDIITNDPVSYFRERNTVDNDLNFITFIQKQMDISLQKAVDRCVEHIVHIHHQWVSATESAFRSKVASKWFPELEHYLKTIIPRATYGCMTTYELLSRNRADRRQPDFNRMLATGRWTCDEKFFNESNPNNFGRSFDQYLEKYEHLKDQKFL